MALELTVNTLNSLSDLSLKPVIVLQIEGVDYVFSTGPVQDFIQVGCPGLFVNNINGDPWNIGGLKPLDNNKVYLDKTATTFTIQQQMNQEEGASSSVSTMTMGLVDANQEITELMSPGFVVEDLLGRKAKVYVGFGDTSFFLDYNLVFRGEIAFITSDAGLVRLRIDHPDAKKLAPTFKEVDTVLDGAIDDTQLTLTVENATNILTPVTPFGSDVSVSYTPYLRIDDEFVEVVSKVGETITITNRGAESTFAAAHSDQASVSMVHKIEGNPLDIAQAIMLSGNDELPTIEDVEVTSFVNIGDGTVTDDSGFYFKGLNIPRDLGLIIGDRVTIIGATNAANNIIDRGITGIFPIDSGYYITVDGADLTLEANTSATASFRSKYSVLPDGLGFAIGEVDSARHEQFKDFFFSATAMRFFIEEEIEGREFIDEQCYKPIACYGLPRKASSSLGYTIGPIPGTEVKVLDDTTITNPANTLKISRSLDKAFFNEVLYKYDPSLLTDKYLAGFLNNSEDSKNRITRKSYRFDVVADGLRRNLDGEGIAQFESNRIIDRYKFGAEIVSGEMLLRDGFAIEIGDIVIGDLLNLQVSDIEVGSRAFQPRLFEVLNIKKNFKTGDVSFSMLDTGFGPDTRFGLMSPCSLVGQVFNPQQFTIKRVPGFGSIYDDDEYRFWETIANVTEDACIRFTDPVTEISENALLESVVGPNFTISAPLSVLTLATDLVVEYCEYPDVNVSDKQKLVWAWMTDDVNFPDGSNPYTML